MRFAVKEIREKSGMTRDELSEKAGVPMDLLLDIEENKIEVCNSRVLVNIADALGISSEFLFV